MRSRPDSKTHIFRAEARVPVEKEILSSLIRPGCRVLDVGTAATGRSATMCRDLGAHVTSIDFNEAAIREFAASGKASEIALAVADLRDLPFSDGVFELVLVAFHGIDYLTAKEDRHAAYAEMGRVLGTHGHAVFNSFNRIATTTSPLGLRSRTRRKQQLRHILRGGPFRRSVIDEHGLELHQAFPRTVIRDMERHAQVELDYVTNRSGSTRRLSLITPLTVAPYYVFRR